MDKFSIGDKVTPIKGSHKGDIGTVENVLFAPNMENEYKISFETKPYYLTLYESSLQAVEASFSEQILAGGHAGHGFTGNEVHLEMAQIGWYHPKKKNEPEAKDSKSIWVYAEGDHPDKHFHFYRGKDRKRGGCICLDKSMYFPHDGHDDTLNNQEIKVLVSFLNSIDPDSGLTIWKAILLSWNQQNSRFRIDMNSPIPPYESGIQMP